MTADQQALVQGLSPATIAGLTAYLEARNQPVLGIAGVVFTIANRAVIGTRGKTWSEVCVSPWQYSCWNDHDPNQVLGLTLADQLSRNVSFDRTTSDAIVLHTSLWLALQVQGGAVDDPTHGATHYYAPGAVAAPLWVKAPARRTVQIADHLFYTNVAM